MTDLAKPEQQLLDLLKQHDSLGNGKARELLGWDEALYEQVKGSLVAAGQVVLGRGRGGSIRLAEPSGIQASGQQASSPLSQQAPEPKASKPTGPKAKGSEAQGQQATGPQANGQETTEPIGQQATCPGRSAERLIGLMDHKPRSLQVNSLPGHKAIRPKCCRRWSMANMNTIVHDMVATTISLS